MAKHTHRVLFLAFLGGGLSIYFSCTQPDDILTPVKGTELHLWGKIVVPGEENLMPQNLPTNPKGMIYELWVANDQDTLSLGKFGYHQTRLTFHDESGNRRPDDNHFVLDGDIFEYSHIFVSVETNPDPKPTVPGPIMLIDEVTDPTSDLIELRFPLNDSLTTTTVRFNMETPSNGDRDSLDGYGIWFSSYDERTALIQDTFRLDSFTIDTIWKEEVSGGETTAVVNILDIRDSVIVQRVFGFDTDSQYTVRWRDSIEIDSTAEDSFLTTRVTFFFDIDTVIDTITYDVFTQDNFALPDYSAYDRKWKWKYKGWIVSPEVPKSARGEITLPAYKVNNNPSDSLIPGITGGLLTTGTFTNIEEPDEGNPYTIGPRVPPFPGEDFLKNLPGGLKAPPSGSWGGLMPDSADNSGTVFITLEPDNFVTDTTNFPLFAFVKRFPANRAAIEDYSNTFTFNLTNLTETSSGATRGFPRIVVDIRRF